MLTFEIVCRDCRVGWVLGSVLTIPGLDHPTRLWSLDDVTWSLSDQTPNTRSGVLAWSLRQEVTATQQRQISQHLALSILVMQVSHLSSSGKVTSWV